MAEDTEGIVFEKKGAVGWVFFSRPERMNALSSASMQGIWRSLGKLEADPAIRVVAFTGRGEAFCAGMDLAGLERAAPLAARRRSREIQMSTSRIAEFSLPTIAAVNGVAMGVGLEICLCCDLVVACEAARFAFPETRLGMIPCGGGTQRLARLIGLRRAREMVLTGRVIDAEQALQWGLVNEVVRADELIEKVEELAARVAMGGRIALYQAKRCLNHALDMDLNRGLEYETECFTTCFSTGEPAAGLKKFAESAAEEPAPGPREEGEEREAAGKESETAPAAGEGTDALGQAEASRREEEGDIFE